MYSGHGGREECWKCVVARLRSMCVHYFASQSRRWESVCSGLFAAACGDVFRILLVENNAEAPQHWSQHPNSQVIVVAAFGVPTMICIVFACNSLKVFFCVWCDMNEIVRRVDTCCEFPCVCVCVYGSCVDVKVSPRPHVCWG